MIVHSTADSTPILVVRMGIQSAILVQFKGAFSSSNGLNSL